MPGVNTPKPWDRRADETTKAYEAFCIYRDMGTQRSLSKVAEKLQKSETLMGRWSGKHEWVDRAAKWDDEQDRIEREAAQKEHLKAIKDMRKRQADSGYALQIKGIKALQKIPDTELTAADIVRLVIEGAKLERIGRGDVGDVIEERTGSEVTDPVTFYMPDNGRDGPRDEEEPQ